IRAVLAARTGAKTIPQVFIGGTHVGGATEMFDAWRNGKARELLGKRGVAFDAKADLDPYSLLPKWLQPRKSA
ncbi:MAG TPA: glutaredoxin domain-containing protein, partial [Gammaproteobacteria bacterium]